MLLKRICRTKSCLQVYLPWLSATGNPVICYGFGSMTKCTFRASNKCNNKNLFWTVETPTLNPNSQCKKQIKNLRQRERHLILVANTAFGSTDVSTARTYNSLADCFKCGKKEEVQHIWVKDCSSSAIWRFSQLFNTDDCVVWQLVDITLFWCP